MKKLAAPLVALLLMPACGGERAQNPGANEPPGTPGTATVNEMAPAPAPEPTATTPAPTAAPAETAPPKTLSEMEKDGLRALMAALNAHDAMRSAALYAPEARIAGVGPSGWMEQVGPAVVEDEYRRMFTAFPDMKMSSPRAYQSGAVVIQEWVFTGTNKGELGGKKATDKPVGIQGASVYWFSDDGLILRDHAYYDAASIGTQTGATKGKARALAQHVDTEPVWFTATGSTEDSRWVDAAKALLDAYDNRDEKGYFATLAKDVVVLDYTMTSDRTGAPAAREDFRAIIKAFPDLKMTNRNVWGFGDRVVVESAMTGTHTGTYEGVKPSRKPVTMHRLDVLRFNGDGKVIERATYGSTLELHATAAPPSKTAPATKQQGTPDENNPSPGYHMSPGGSQYFPQPNPYPSNSPHPGPNPPPNPTSSGVQ